MWSFFKVLLSGKPSNDEELSDSDNINPSLEHGDTEPRYIPKVNKEHKKVKEKVIINKEQPIKETHMAEVFLVVVDTTNRPEAKNFAQGIQNFYFVYANDEELAKGIVLHTFRSRPELVSQLQYCVKATRLSAIVKGLGPGSNFWTYVPFGRQRAPGQQAVLPNPDALLRNDEYGNPSSRTYVPPAPIGGEEITEEDLKKVQFSGADGKVLNKLRNPTGKPVEPLPEELPPPSPEVAALTAQMAQMQAMMAQMIQAQTKPTRAKKTKVETAANPPIDETQPS